MSGQDCEPQEVKKRLSFSIESILSQEEIPKPDVAYSPYKDAPEDATLNVTCYGSEAYTDISCCSCENEEMCNHERTFYCRESQADQTSPGQNESTKDKADTLKAKSKKKTRTVFSRHQVFYLEAAFDAKRYLSSAERSEIASTLSLSETQVKVWFQNRRNKWKSQMNGDGKLSPNHETGPLFFPSFIGGNFQTHAHGRPLPYPPPPPFFRQPVYY